MMMMGVGTVQYLLVADTCSDVAVPSVPPTHTLQCFELAIEA
jgi:hypothetical protein